MSSFGLELSELFNTPKSTPKAPSKTGRLLNGALPMMNCSSNQSQFFLSSQKVYCSLQEQFRHPWYLPKEKVIVLHPFVTNPSFQNPLSRTKEAKLPIS